MTYTMAVCKSGFEWHTSCSFLIKGCVAEMLAIMKDSDLLLLKTVIKCDKYWKIFAYSTHSTNIDEDPVFIKNKNN